MQTMLFKQNLSSKLPMRTMPLEQVDMPWEQAKKARLVDLKYVSLYRDLLQPLTSKQNLSSKIQLLWHIYTHKGLNDRIRFKTMLSMTKSWASFSWNPPLRSPASIQSIETTSPRLSFFSVVFIFIVSRFPAATLDWANRPSTLNLFV